jgi:hypothetical protein
VGFPPALDELLLLLLDPPPLLPHPESARAPAAIIAHVVVCSRMLMAFTRG